MQPSTHRSLLITALLWPLLITVVMLGGLYIFGYYEQQRLVRDNTAQHVNTIVESSQALALDLDTEIRSAERSITSYRDEFVQQWQRQQDALPQLSRTFREHISLARDGAYRSRVETFDADRQAGVWLPKYIEWQASYWPLLAVAQTVTQSFGRGTQGRYFVDTWYMPSFGGIVIYWPKEPEFIYRAAADFDYRNSEWITLTTPINNPDRRVRWTSPSFDEVPQMWMISVVAPLYLDGHWMGSVGHDVPLNDVLRLTTATRNKTHEQFLLLSATGKILATDRYHEQLLAQHGQLTLAQLGDEQLNTVYDNVIGESRYAFAQSEKAISFAHKLADGQFVLLHQVSLQPVVALVDKSVARSKSLIAVALLLQFILTMILSYLSYRRAVKDFTDLDAVQDRLRIALTDAAYNTREISAISYGISHDLRAPLRHLTGFTQMLREQSLTRMNADDLALVHKIESATRRATRLTEKLLTYLRIAQQELRCKDLNLQSLLERVVVEAVAEWPNSKVEWRLNAQLMIYADPTMLRELFYQLFDNALAAVVNQTEPMIVVEAEKTVPWVRITVRDNGPGFDNERAEHLFEMFQRLSAEQARGPGVGLAIARRIVERHGGKIQARCEPDQGAEFVVQLPLTMS